MTELAPSYMVTTHTEDDGTFWAEVDDLPGCFASGDTEDELWENLKEAVGMYLSDEHRVVKIHTAVVHEVVPTEKKYELVTS